MTTVSRDVLEECVSEAIERRLNATGKIAQNSPYGPLLGYCYSNSLVLHEVLDERGIESRIVGGGRAYDLPDPDEDVDYDPQTAEELSEGIPLHFWVEVDADETTYVLELATEVRPNRGPPAIHTGLPDDLVRYPDSYDYPQEILEEDLAEARICPYCGDNPKWDACAETDKTCACGRGYDSIRLQPQFE